MSLRLEIPNRIEVAFKLKALAVIPARGGSKGIPRKNVRLLCGKPLIAWTIEAAQQAASVGRVVVSTDDPEIGAVSKQYGAEVVWRPASISGDTASSESVLVHTLEQLGIRQGRMAFLQCTAPLMLPEDIDGTLGLLDRCLSAFTAAPWHRFVWREETTGVEPLGHTKRFRPNRQQKQREFLEVGAVYAIRIEDFLAVRSRFIGRCLHYEIPFERSFEIDEEPDFFVVESLLRARLAKQKSRLLPDPVKALITDFDGVLTDNTMWISEDGKEAVRCNRGDGWALRRLQEQGLRLLILSSETNPVVQARSRKLGVECVVAQNKLAALKDWLDLQGLDPSEAVYVGNDVPDAECLAYVGCGVTPADAYPAAKEAAQIVLETPGGRGCIRELAELILARSGGAVR